jgi:hypothetical protein
MAIKCKLNKVERLRDREEVVGLGRGNTPHPKMTDEMFIITIQNGIVTRIKKTAEAAQIAQEERENN